MGSPDLILQDLLAHDSWIRALARHLVSDEHTAEDLAQEAWVEVLEKPPHKVGRLTSWLGGVVRNLGAMRQRADTSRQKRERAAAKPERVPSVAEMRAREKMRFRVARAVFNLEEPYRSVVLYRYFENLSPRDISSLLDVSARAVEERLRRGLQKLRARLDREFGDRRSWCAALLPLVGQGTTAAGAAAGATSASLLSGALVMSTKIKIGIAVLVALGAAYALWPRDEVEPPEVPKAEIAQPVAPVAKKAGEAEPAVAKEGEATREAAKPQPEAAPEPISLEPARGSIVGVVTDQDGAPIAGASVKALRFIPGAVELQQLLETKTDKAGRYVLKPIQKRCAVEARAEGHYAEQRLASPFTRKDFVLGKPGILQGRVLIAATGGPCADATVAVYRFETRDHLEFVEPVLLRKTWLRPPTATTRSELSGYYRFGNLRPGPYQVRVLPLKHPSDHSGNEAVVVASGNATTHNLSVGRGVTISGRVTDRQNQAPIMGAKVCVLGNYRRVAVTGADGGYTLQGVEPRALILFKVEARGYIGADAQHPIGKSHGCTEVRDFELQPGVLVSGRVLGPDGEPVPGARVGRSSDVLRVPTEDAMISHFRGPATRTDSQGRFEVTHFASGRMRRVYAIKDGLAWGASEPFTATAGQARSDIVIRLGKGGSIVGRVVDQDGKSMPGAQLALFQRNEDRRVEFSRADGRFEFEAVPAGVYAMEVFPPGLVEENHSTYTRLTRDGITVGMGQKSEVKLVLRPGSHISGRVLDLCGVPVEGVAVKAMPESQMGRTSPFQHLSTRVTLTDARGQFRVEGLLPGQTYYLKAGKPGYNRPFVKGVPSGSSDTVFVLIAVRTLEGRVASSQGEPIPEFRIRGSRIRDPAGGKVNRSEFSVPFGLFADPAGRFRLSLIPGSYRIEAEAPGGLRSDSRTVEVSPHGKQPVVELVVRTGASVHGIVRTSSGIAVALARVRVLDLSVTPPKQVGGTTTGSDGRFKLDSLSPGSVRIEAFDGVSVQEIARVIELRAGSNLEADLTLHPGVQVAVTVRGPGKRPIDGARVMVQRADGVPLFLDLSRFKLMKAAAEASKAERRRLPNMAEAQKRINHSLEFTDANGCLAVLHLIPGDYRLRAAAPGYKPWTKTVRIGSGSSQTVEIVLEKE
jgi:RNA polymerase sigma-70 factor (ECF subfamily)